MSDLTPSDMAIGTLALACAIFYAAWHEYAAKNHRDAKSMKVHYEMPYLP